MSSSPNRLPWYGLSEFSVLKSSMRAQPIAAISTTSKIRFSVAACQTAANRIVNTSWLEKHIVRTPARSAGI